MLEGIDILNQVEILKWNRSLIIPCFILLILLCVACVSIGESHDAAGVGLGIIGVLIIFPLLILILLSQPSEPTGRYEYTVTIDESVSFTDLCENYEIVEQNGQLWTLRDKKN